MKIRRRSKLLVESPSVATGDIAFNLLVFFLVCASVQPESGRPQDIPRSEEKKEKVEQSQNLEVSMTRTTVGINGQTVPLADFASRIRQLLAGKSRPEDKIVVVKSAKDTPYAQWILVTGAIEDSGGTITLQLQEEQVVPVP